ncbi:hypothetical protein C0J52_27394, partial [Blattella germanica]
EKWEFLELTLAVGGRQPRGSGCGNCGFIVSKNAFGCVREFSGPIVTSLECLEQEQMLPEAIRECLFFIPLLREKKQYLEIMAEMNTDEMDCSDIEEAWKEGCASLIPEKSKRRYELAYEKFMKWVNDKKTNVNEKTLLAYFVRRVGAKKWGNPVKAMKAFSLDGNGLGKDFNLSLIRRLKKKKKKVELQGGLISASNGRIVPNLSVNPTYFRYLSRDRDGANGRTNIKCCFYSIASDVQSTVNRLMFQWGFEYNILDITSYFYLMQNLNSPKTELVSFGNELFNCLQDFCIVQLPSEMLNDRTKNSTWTGNCFDKETNIDNHFNRVGDVHMSLPATYPLVRETSSRGIPRRYKLDSLYYRYCNNV